MKQILFTLLFSPCFAQAQMVFDHATKSPDGATSLIFRGENSMRLNNRALIIVDGKIRNDYDNVSPSIRMDSFQFNQAINGNFLNNLNPDNIVSATVLNGATASVLYRSRGENGAIIISTLAHNGSEGIR